MLVYLPHDPCVRISQRIEDEAEREALRQRLQALIAEDEEGGFIIRTQGDRATDEELATDQAYLKNLWADIQQRARSQAAPSLLYQDLNLAQRVLRDMVQPNTLNIFVDSRTTTQALTEWAKVYTPSVVNRIQHYSGERSEEHTSELQSRGHLVCRLLLEKKK